MRVGLHVGQLFQRVPGGIGRVTELLCAELPARADVVAFSSCSHRARRDFDAHAHGDVEFRHLGRGSPRWRYELWSRFRTRRIALDVDVCHAPSLAIPPTSAPLVVTVNDIAFLRHPETFTGHGIRFHERGLSIARREAVVVIVPSEFTRRELIDVGFDAARIHCAPLAVGRRGHSVPAAVEDELRRRGVHRPYLLAAGTIEPRKDHATVLAAFDRLRRLHPDLSLVIAGPTGWLPARAAPARRGPGVVMLGPVTDGVLDGLYDRAEVVVSASVYEGFGLTVLEGLAHGRPVVATAIPPHREVAADAARFFAPRDVGALTDRVDDLLRDATACADLGRAARARAARFDVASTIDAHIAAYEEAVLGGV